MHVRVCSECGEEFRPEIARCSDCGGALVDRHDDEGAGSTGATAFEAAVDTRPLAHAADVRDLVRLADGLRKAGIPSRITQGEASDQARSAGFDLGVRDGDRLAAMAVLEFVSGGVTVLDAPPATEDERGEVVCPACGTFVSEGVIECLECGLILGSDPGH